MKKYGLILLVIFVIIFCTFVTVSYVKSFRVPKAEPILDNHTPEVKPERSKYDIVLDYNGKNKISAKMDFTYINNTEIAQKDLYFHLYPNMFLSKKHLPFYKNQIPRVFPQGVNFGGIKINNITTTEGKVTWSLEQKDQFLKISLPSPIKPKDISHLNIDYELIVPHANFRFGYRQFGKGKITMSLGNWYPVLAVFEDGKWILDHNWPFGDWTYSDIADYKVKFAVPKDFTVAASGVLQDEYEEKEKKVFLYSSEKLRDFAACISNNYEIAEDFIDDVVIYSYFHPEDKNGGFMALNVAKYALGIFNKHFGRYPYPELRIAEANYYPGGMEFPTLIMMNTVRYKQPQLSNTSLERSVAHEVAHQWWYSVVGNNQIKEPWVDEGLTEFSTSLYFEKRYGLPGREAYHGRHVDTLRGLISKSPRKMTDALTEFTDSTEYFAVVYTNGVLFFEDLRDKIGEDNLMEFLNSYYETFKFQNVRLADFKSFLKDKNYETLDESFFKKWF